jgi:hypothetical protein
MKKDNVYFEKQEKKNSLLNNEFKFRHINNMLGEDDFLKTYFSFQIKLKKELYADYKINSKSKIN